MKELLQNLIQNFSTENLIQLFRNKSNKFRQVTEEANNYNNDFFSNSLLFGEIILDDDDELVIFAFKTNKELTERSGKKAQYELAKKILKEAQRYSAGFFIFYDNDGNFRLSLIYDIPQPNGKREWSNFKRFTYYVSKDQTNKTFISRLDTVDFTSLDKIKEAFSVEKVTKEFYTEIANWYFWALDEVEFPDDEDNDREQRNAKNLIRLITRIIFVWFMKEKKLVPPSLFDKPVIDQIINYKDKTGSTYYKAILQNLFFATLNTPMKTNNSNSRIFVEDAEKRGYINDGYLQPGYYRYSRYIKNENLFFELFTNIPFLNGGLFECLDKKINVKEIRVDCFSNNPKNETRLKAPDKLFFLEKETEVDLSKHLDSSKNKKVRGLLTILKSYNFTIDENTPVDEEVALDPELLGKVFENLLASYNPETSTTARKATGSYYTPREIVEYMVNESLVAYLRTKLDDESKETEERIRLLFDYNTDENSFIEQPETILKIIDAIENVKILDPACGSGAFPMGILHKLVLALHKLDPNNNIWKKRLLDRVPAEIRDETEKSLENKSLDYIRKLGLIEHCIYGVDIQEIAIQISKLRFFISLLVEQQIDDSKTNRDVRSLPNLETKFVAANTLIELEKPSQLVLGTETDELETQLFGLREEIFYTNSRREKLELQKKEKQLREDLKAVLTQSGFQSNVAERIVSWDPFDQNTHAEWFDPEWMFGPDLKNGFDIVIANPPYGADIPEKEKEYLKKKHINIIERIRNSFLYFIGEAYCLVKSKGVVCFILPNEFLFQIYMTKARRYFLNNSLFLFTINLGEDIFKAIVPTSVIAFSKLKVDNYLIPVADFRNKNLADLPELLITSKFPAISNKSILSSPNSAFSFDLNTAALINRILEISEPFEKFCYDVANGISTSCDEIYIVSSDFVIENNFEKEYLKECIRGFQFDRFYCPSHTDDYILYITNDFDKSKAKNIYAYLFKNKSLLIRKSIEKKQGIRNWYVLFRSRYENLFKKPKILFRQTGDRIIATIDDEVGYYCIDSVNVSQLNFNYHMYLEYLIGLLNSRLMVFFYQEISQEKSRVLAQVKPQRIRSLPIRLGTSLQIESISILVKEITSTKKNNSQASTKHLEDQIDLMVYKLYNLTYEEVKIIDPEIEKIISKEDYEKFEIK